MNKQVKTVFFIVVGLCLLGSMASASTPNLELVVPSVSEAPEIDGVLNDAAWLQASLRGGKVVQDVNHTGTALTAYPRIAYVAYDDEALYIAYTIFAPDVEKLQTSGANPWDNDEVEVFLDPKARSYFQMALDSSGKLFISDGGPSRDAIQFAMDKSGIRWTVEIAIPFDAIGGAPEAGDTWGLGLNGRQISVGDMWLTWNPTYGGFLNPSRFGRITFGE